MSLCINNIGNSQMNEQTFHYEGEKLSIFMFFLIWPLETLIHLLEGPVRTIHQIISFIYLKIVLRADL